MTFTTACSDTSITDADRENLTKLLFALPMLGSPEDWTNPDGSAKTMAQLMGDAKQAEVYASVKKMADKAEHAD
ncbi:hypothetical protein ACJEJ5_24550, partial [Escherichia coli]